MHIDLGRVEGALPLRDHVRQSRGVQGVLERCLGLVPLSDLPDELVRAGRQLCLELGQAVVAQQPDHEVEQAGQFIGQLIRPAEDMRVVLGKATCPGQPVHDARLLEPVDSTELEEP